VASPSLAKDINPLLRRAAKLEAESIASLVWPGFLDALRAGAIRRDGPWSSDRVDRCAGWISSGIAD
jgi:hypothetical protein